MIQIVALGLFTAIALAILMYKINIDFFVKFQWQTDVVVSIGLMYLMIGSFDGAMTAILAGIFVSLFLYVVGLIR